MTRLAEIQGHIAGMDELQDIVGAMRSLAGMRVQEALRALDGIRRYAASMRAAIASALLLAPPAAEAGGAGRGSPRAPGAAQRLHPEGGGGRAQALPAHRRI